MEHAPAPATPTPATSLPLGPALWRGLLLRCPHCGEGKLFRRYVKQVEHCAACGESYGTLRADDGPAWLTIVVVGHIIAPLMLVLLPANLMPDWAATVLLMALALVLTIGLLPRMKGLFLAFMWRQRLLHRRAHG